MESMFVCIICVIAFAAGLLCGYGLGRNVSARGTDGCRSNSSGSGFADTEETVERAVRTNEEAAATIKRMRDIFNRHCGVSKDTPNQVETK